MDTEKLLHAHSQEHLSDRNESNPRRFNRRLENPVIFLQPFMAINMALKGNFSTWQGWQTDEKNFVRIFLSGSNDIVRPLCEMK